MAYGGVKLGSFMLRSGITSPIYLGLHALISDMCLYSSIASLLHTLPVMRPYGRFFGIPYSGLPIAVVCSSSTILSACYVLQGGQGPKSTCHSLFPPRRDGRSPCTGPCPSPVVHLGFEIFGEKHIDAWHVSLNFVSGLWNWIIPRFWFQIEANFQGNMSSGFERSREVNGISVDTDGRSTKIQCLDDLSDLRDQADWVRNA